MGLSSKLSVSLLCATSVVALATAARAQDTATTETVVVTGSRVISDAANSPTPLTVVTTQQLLATTPSDIPDALNKLPVFQGSNSARSINNASTNAAGNVLNLRNFGAQRTLVLLDGHRVAPSNADGTVDVDTLPQMLMTRVDVVTGGASAVYGSDAVTGVVNFVLDKHFSGVKIDANAGISNFADSMSYKLGVAAGTDLFGGRGHFEMAARHYYEDPVKTVARPEGLRAWELSGAGTTANPYVTIPAPALTQFAYGGKITCAGCTANGQQFIANGVIGPFNAGTPTGTANLNSGGDGPHSTLSDITSGLMTDDLFGRFSYNIDDTTSAYVQATAAQSSNKGVFQNNYIQTGTVPNTFYKTNPYLPSSLAAAFAGSASTFQLAEYINDQGPNGGFQSNGLDRNLSLTAGMDGTLMGKYDWDVFYTHGESRLKVDDPHNQNNQKMYAAEDTVTNAAGNPVCFASLSTNSAIAAEYRNCVPMNPFGPTALSSQAWNYFTQDSHFIMNNILDDVGGSISGDVFDLPAGPIKAALSGEMRWLSYQVSSNATPSDTIDCTGLRLCNSATAFWQGNIANSSPEVSENVWEFAGEADVPLLKDLPLVQTLDANIAGRYTDYSVSGAVQTWKIGLDYHLNDDIRFRATNSVDIRAPTLNDLYSPVQNTHSGYADLHTGNTQGNVLVSSQGNANLVPEVARTYTAGVVLTPTFIPGFTASVDYYTIALKNAISSIGGTNQNIQLLCEQSGGTSSYCSLYVRPLAFSNTTAANFPTEVLTTSLNAAINKTEGWDIELNYGFEMADIVDQVPGSVSLRLLTNIQPVEEAQNYAGAPVTYQALPKGHVTGFVSYTLGDWQFNLQNRWLSDFPRSTQAGQIYAQARAPQRDYTDINIDKKFTIDDSTLDAYFSVQNLLGQTVPIIPTNLVSPGLYFVGIQGANTGYDAIGRYFTLGVRARL